MSRTIYDCHVHLYGIEHNDRLLEIADTVGLERVGIVCTPNPEMVNHNPAALICKASYPDRVYAFCGLDHSIESSGRTAHSLDLDEQVDKLIAMGADGIKMLEGKPTTRRWLNIPVDTDYFTPYFEKMNDTRFPILWHVNDPEEFWDPELLPPWAAKHDWGYKEDDVKKEDQYTEVGNVLDKYPNLNIIFAHMYFLSADLPRAARLLDKHPNINFDLAPGIEFLYNMSHNTDETREFFIKYADRIVYGTDISSGNTDAEAISRSGIITRWLETEDEYRVPDDVDMLLGKPDEGIMRGIKLPDDVLDKIYTANYLRITGGDPKPFKADLAAEECRRLAAIAKKPEQAIACAEALEAL